MTEATPAAAIAEPGVPAAGDVAAPAVPRRQPGDPHPYMLQRNPPNLWFLAMMTAIALVVALVVMILTVWL
jgi:hypothetical protein